MHGKRVFVAEGEKDYLAIAATGIYASGVFAPTASLSIAFSSWFHHLWSATFIRNGSIHRPAKNACAGSPIW